MFSLSFVRINWKIDSHENQATNLHQERLRLSIVYGLLIKHVRQDGGILASLFFLRVHGPRRSRGP